MKREEADYIGGLMMNNEISASVYVQIMEFCKPIFGFWIYYGGYYKCSNCGHEQATKTAFCPQCGQDNRENIELSPMIGEFTVNGGGKL